MLKSIRSFNLCVRSESGYIFLWIVLLLMEVNGNKYSQYRYHDILWD